ncbi:hypothetical protein CPB84DRAFT_1772236 [Gymnopilus junonius]|uniref:Uncharacterized protein n=1 Tax=Gymnopilus junonius TaxID=109634 RepID=A0A9P5TPI4_GYMJU|nr:hypothetical protein CPB84DRAFT_1772236 [Gymnopilus junonius]
MKLPNIQMLSFRSERHQALVIMRSWGSSIDGSYTNWKLKDISIWRDSNKSDSGIMLALARSIPSINSFFGRGHMLKHAVRGWSRISFT